MGDWGQSSRSKVWTTIVTIAVCFNMEVFRLYCVPTSVLTGNTISKRTFFCTPTRDSNNVRLAHYSMRYHGNRSVPIMTAGTTRPVQRLSNLQRTSTAYHRVLSDVSEPIRNSQKSPNRQPNCRRSSELAVGISSR